MDDAQRERLIRTLEIYREVVFPWYPRGTLRKDLAEIKEKQGITENKAIIASVTDAVESSLDWSIEKVGDFDRICEERGAAPLSELRVNYGRRFQRLLKSEKLKSLKDYEFLKPLYDDYVNRLSEEQALKLRKLLNDFEKEILK
jgi:hypothetical protein